MTVTYTGEVATCRGFGTFLKVLYRWRGSIYKLVWLDLLMFLLLYYMLNLTYRLILDEDKRRMFEGVVNYCSFHGNVIPLSFVLGFYVTVVMNRWWNQYTTIPWPDSIAVFVSATIHGQDERGRLMRRTIVRYVCLCLTMVLTMISPRVKKRFPTLDNLVEAGFLLSNEKIILDNLNEKFPKPTKHWLPIVWATSIVTRARKEGRIRDDFAVKTIIDELNKFRGQCGLLLSYDTISVPLVYTQVVTIAVYSYFITSALGSQWVDNKHQSNTTEVYISNIDLYFPIFATLEFFFYMGWLKVAESLINPFGEDDDDFEVNWIIDRDLQVSYMIVDEMHHEHPELIKDQYWDEVFPSELPYTIATENQREEHPEHSTARIAVPMRQRSMVMTTPSQIQIDKMVPSNTVSYKFDPPEGAPSDLNGMHQSGSGTEIDKMVSPFIFPSEPVSYKLDVPEGTAPSRRKCSSWSGTKLDKLAVPLNIASYKIDLPEVTTPTEGKSDKVVPSPSSTVNIKISPPEVTTPTEGKSDEVVPSPSSAVNFKFGPQEQLQMNDDAVSGIHFIVSRGSKRGKKEDRNSMGSTNSMASLAQQTPIPRNNSVTSMLKRLFSKEEQRGGSAQTDAGSRFTISASNPQLNKPVTAGSMKIANDVIEEVDEQATITSMAKRPEARPTAMSLFTNMPPPSNPVDMPPPKNSNHSSRTPLSSSAPNPWNHYPPGDVSPAAASLDQLGSLGEIPRARLDSDVGPELSAAGSHTQLDEIDGEDEEGMDDFERLKSKREKERRIKHSQKLMARSISAQQRTGSMELIDNDLLLEDLLMQSGALKKEDQANRDTT